MEHEILTENVKTLANTVIITKTFSDEVRLANRARAAKLIERFKIKKAKEEEKMLKNMPPKEE